MEEFVTEESLKSDLRGYVGRTYDYDDMVMMYNMGLADGKQNNLDPVTSLLELKMSFEAILDPEWKQKMYDYPTRKIRIDL